MSSMSMPADQPHLGRFKRRFESEAESLQRAIEDFSDPSQEWRRLFSELLGTFFLVLVAAGGGVMGQAFPNTISRTAAVVAPGLMVMAIILFMGKVSGAHLNPAVSIAFSLRGDFPWRRVPGYIVVQLIGATLAAWFLQATVHVSATYGSSHPASGFSAGSSRRELAVNRLDSADRAAGWSAMHPPSNGAWKGFSRFHSVWASAMWPVGLGRG